MKTMDVFLQGMGVNTVMACALALLAWTLGYVWRRPQVLHVLWVLVLLKLVTPPVWELPIAWKSEKSVSIIHQAPMVEASTEKVQVSEPVDVATASEPLTLSVESEMPVIAPEMGPFEVPFTWMRFLLVVWLLGSIGMAARMVFGVRKVHGLLRRGEEAPGHLLARVASLSDQLSLKRFPRVRLVSLHASPFVLQLLGRAWLALPKPLMQTFNEDQLNSVLAHELLHLKRGDHWVRWLEAVVSVLLWWHPVVWWTRRELSALEEECCDAAILTRWPTWRKAYAAALAKAFDGVSNPAPMLASGLGSTFRKFVRRVERISEGRVRPPVPRLVMLGVVIIGSAWLGMAVSLTQEAEDRLERQEESGFIYVKDESDDEVGEGTRLFRDIHRQDVEVVRKVRLKLSAPRGRILDQHGKVLAGNKTVDYLVLPIPTLSREAPDDAVVTSGQALIEQANALLGTKWSLEDAVVLTNFRNRRAVPLLVGDPLTNEHRVKLMESDLLSPWMGALHRESLRIYPHGKRLAHTIGYVHRVPPDPKMLEEGQSLYGVDQGRFGLEKAYDAKLVGVAGEIELSLDRDGAVVKTEVLTQPQRGIDLVTTLDVDLAGVVEGAVKEASDKSAGAFVMVDVRTGGVVGLQSWPSFDPNVFVPWISPNDYSELIADPDFPVFARAVDAVYPPGSLIKPLTALAALKSGAITETTKLSAPGRIQVGKRWKKNWHHSDEGEMDVRRAIARSSNTWFYQAGIQTGGASLRDMSQSFGYGERVALPLGIHQSGRLPDAAQTAEDGDVANLAIGQGRLEASPLQMVQQLVRLSQAPRAARGLRLTDQAVESGPSYDWPGSARHFDLMRQGMVDIVHVGYGTAKRLAIPDMKMAGITATSMWKAGRRIAIAGGYFPADQPRYAFVLCLEGGNVSGSKEASQIANAILGQWLGKP